MSKLIYAKSKAGFESAFGTNLESIDKSIAFIEDGYIWTHGKYFKMFPSSSDGSSFLTADVSNNIVALKDGLGNTVVSFDRGIYDITGDSKIGVSISSGKATLNLKELYTADQTTGPSANSSSTIIVPQITFDKYGLYKSVTNRTATLNQVVQTAQTGSTNYYILGSSSPETSTATTNKTAKIFFNAGSGLLTATEFSEDGTTLADKYAPKSHVTVKATGSTLGHVTLSDSLNDSSGAGSGVAATPKAIKDVYDYAKDIISSNDAMLFKGTIGANGIITGQADVNSKTLSTLDDYKIGWTFRVSVTQTIANVGVLEVGDIVIAIKDRGSSYLATDFTVIQVNIDGAVTAGVALTADQLIVGSGTSSIKVLSAGTNGHILTMVSGKPAWKAAPAKTYREIKVDGTTRLASSVLDAINFKAGTGISLGYSSGDLTVSTVLQNLNIQNSGTAVGSYNPTGSTNHTINFSDGLKSSLSTNVFTVGHTNSVTAQTTLAVRSFTYDKHGHITDSSTVTKLPNPNAITFVGATNLSYDGSTARTIKFAKGTDISITGALDGSTMTYTPSITHKYRALNVIKTKGGTSTAMYNNSTATALTYAAGDNVSIDFTTNVLTFNAVNTWRDVKARNISNDQITALTSISQASLDFGEEFIWANNELKLGWAEVASNGTITYAV